MSTWSKSPAAQAQRAKRDGREACHFVALGTKRTACGREVTPNSAMWICSNPVKTRCKRCAIALDAKGLLPGPVDWLVSRGSDPIGKEVSGRCEGSALQTAIERFDDGFDSMSLSVKLKVPA